MIRKILASILIILLFFNNICVIASFQSDAAAIVIREQPNIPARPVPVDPGKPVVKPPRPVIIPQTKQALVTYNGIKGNVFEDYKQYTNSSGIEAQVLDNNVVKDFNEPGVKDVIVQLLNESGQVVKTKYTDDSGNFSFSIEEDGISPGNYKIRYIYGMLDNDQCLEKTLKDTFKLTGIKPYNNTKEIQNVLKYNGQDYISKFSSVTPTYTSYEEKIINMREGYAQIFLVFDCSVSMTDKNNLNEKGQTKLEVMQESAIELVEGLFENGEKNISIGTIGFGTTSAMRKHLSNNKEDVINAIKKINDLPGGQSYGSETDIAEAVLKAEDAFINKDCDMSNRIIVLLSDGAPIRYRGQKIYSDDDFEQKLREFAINTNNDIKGIINRGAKFISVIPKSENAFENILVNLVLQDTGTAYNPTGLIDVANIIKQEIKLEIEENSQEATEEWGSITFSGDENPERRRQVNENYKTMDYNKIETLNLENLENLDIDKIKNLVNDSYMYTEENHYCEINPVIDEDDEYYILANGKKYSKEQYNGYKNLTHQANLALIERSPSSLEVSTKITAMRVILSDGSVFKPLTKIAENVITDKDVEPGKVIKSEDIKDISNLKDCLVQTVDNELIHGATVQIEYFITVKNTSTYDFNKFSLIDYAPIGMVMDPDTQLLTEDNFNKDYGWKNLSIEELSNGNKISSDKLNSMTNYMYPITTIDVDNGVPTALRGEWLRSGGERYIKVVFQAVINGNADNLNYENEVEILEYSNKESRRMGEESEKVDNFMQTIHIQETTYIKPGNGCEFDYSNQFKVIILPPFGKWHYYSWGIIILAILISFITRLKLHKRK